MDAIVLATDFTQVSDAATDTAIGLAKHTGAPLVVVHAWQPATVSFLDLELMTPPERLAEIASRLQRSMNTLLDRIRSAGVASVEGHLREGVAADEVAQFAKTAGASLVVMGTSAHQGLRAVLLGSVADRIVKIAPCPVMIVRSSDSRSADE